MNKANLKVGLSIESRSHGEALRMTARVIRDFPWALTSWRDNELMP